MRSSTTPSSGGSKAHCEAVALALVDHALDVLRDLLGGVPVRRSSGCCGFGAPSVVSCDGAGACVGCVCALVRGRRRRWLLARAQRLWRRREVVAKRRVLRGHSGRRAQRGSVRQRCRGGRWRRRLRLTGGCRRRVPLHREEVLGCFRQRVCKVSIPHPSPKRGRRFGRVAAQRCGRIQGWRVCAWRGLQARLNRSVGNRGRLHGQKRQQRQPQRRYLRPQRVGVRRRRLFGGGQGVCWQHRLQHPRELCPLARRDSVCRCVPRLRFYHCPDRKQVHSDHHPRIIGSASRIFRGAGGATAGFAPQVA
jgi:hypothetical protein